LRTCQIIEPDYKQITIGLLSSHGLNQGFNRIEALARKIIDFLEQLPLIVSFSICILDICFHNYNLKAFLFKLDNE
jgi:hypothetical protein